MSEAYANAGVNLELGDELSKMLYNASRETWANRAGRFGEPTADVDTFSGLRSLSLGPLLEAPQPEGIVQIMGDDGIGTKVEVAQRVADHSTMAFDLLAMICDDAAVRGFEPVAVTTTLDVQKLQEHMRPDMISLALGYVAAAKVAGVALVNGEVAELGALVGGYGDDIPGDQRFRYNWNATYLAAGHKSRLLDGSKVAVGDYLVAFREEGFRSNGISLVRKTLEKAYGPEWHKEPYSPAQNIGQKVLKPSTIYTPILVEAMGGYDLRNKAQVQISGAAHITGGGVPGKLGRMLAPSGFGADMGALYSPSSIMDHVQELSGVGDEEIYKVWNMGQGMVVATCEPEGLRQLASKHGVEARIVGSVHSHPSIILKSRGHFDYGQEFCYDI